MWLRDDLSCGVVTRWGKVSTIIRCIEVEAMIVNDLSTNQMHAIIMDRCRECVGSAYYCIAESTACTDLRSAKLISETVVPFA